MKLTRLNKNLMALCAATCLLFANSSAADQVLEINSGSSFNSIEIEDFQPAVAQQQLTESLWSSVLTDCSYCSPTYEMQTTELGRMEVVTVIGTAPLGRSRDALGRLHQNSTFNARETHL